MFTVIGVKFRNIGKVYYFDPKELAVRYNDHVIVETARGIEYGTVVMSPTQVTDDKVVLPLKEVIRLATPEDDERERINRMKEKEAYRICKEKIAARGLDMKLIEAEYTFDNSKVLFYFTADGRIDFRELVKDLAGIFRTRIELRQIGVRDETKILGGMGICGRPLCCHTYLSEFAPVSIKMAKEQNLSLNPTKISGCCGRLMCCLKNEADTYAYLNKNLPNKGDLAVTPDGRKGEVQSVNILRQTVRIVVDLENDEKELVEFPVKEIAFTSRRKKNRGGEEAEGTKKEGAQTGEERAEKPRKRRKEGEKKPAEKQIKAEGKSPEKRERRPQAEKLRIPEAPKERELTAREPVRGAEDEIRDLGDTEAKKDRKPRHRPHRRRKKPTDAPAG